jgi:hypothetical protein
VCPPASIVCKRKKNISIEESLHAFLYSFASFGLGVMGRIMGVVWGAAKFTALLFSLGEMFCPISKVIRIRSRVGFVLLLLCSALQVLQKLVRQITTSSRERGEMLDGADQLSKNSVSKP